MTGSRESTAHPPAWEHRKQSPVLVPTEAVLPELSKMFTASKDGCIHFIVGTTIAPRKQYGVVGTAIPIP